MLTNEDASKQGAPPSYEEATSNNPSSGGTQPLPGYTPVQGGYGGPPPGVPPYPGNSEGVGGFTYPQYPSYPANYPANQYPPPSGYPVTNTTGGYPGQTCGGQYGQYGQTPQFAADMDRRIRRRKIIFMTIFIFIMLLVIFAVTRWFLT